MYTIIGTISGIKSYNLYLTFFSACDTMEPLRSGGSVRPSALCPCPLRVAALAGFSLVSKDFSISDDLRRFCWRFRRCFD